MPKKKILLVDDESDYLETYAGILAAAGFEVLTAETGEDALAAIDGYRPDLVLLDVMLPGKSGPEVARELSSRGDAKHVPVVFITGLPTFPEERALDGLPNVRGVIHKTCRPKTVLERLDDILRHER